VFYEEHRMEVRGILRQLCEWKGVEIIEGEVCQDHVHILVSIPPKMSINATPNTRLYMGIAILSAVSPNAPSLSDIKNVSASIYTDIPIIPITLRLTYLRNFKNSFFIIPPKKNKALLCIFKGLTMQTQYPAANY
jgi:hypothetical protein